MKKAAAFLGIGTDNIFIVQVDARYRNFSPTHFGKPVFYFRLLKPFFFIPLQRQHDTRGPGGENRAGKITSKYLNDISNMIFFENSLLFLPMLLLFINNNINKHSKKVILWNITII